jgi:HAD superfamily hydrolase (TIGR01662 family)
MSIQAAFIDRDGTIGGTGHYIHPKDFELFPVSKEALHLLKTAGLKIFALTNQHRISKGQATEQEFVDQFISYGFDDSYICPHSSDSNCECRKPKPGMLLKAAQEYNLDLHKCVVIGDVGDTDMLAAHAVGATKIIVKTGWGEGALNEYRYRWKEVEPDYIAEDILDAAKWVVNQCDK